MTTNPRVGEIYTDAQFNAALELLEVSAEHVLARDVAYPEGNGNHYGRETWDRGVETKRFRRVDQWLVDYGIEAEVEIETGAADTPMDEKTADGLSW